MAKQKSNGRTYTFQTRLDLSSDAEGLALSAYAELFSQAERGLFASLELTKADLNKTNALVKDKEKLSEYEIQTDIDAAKRLKLDQNNQRKFDFTRKFGLTGRQHNAVEFTLGGKIEAIRALRPESIKNLKVNIDKDKKVIVKIEKKLKELKTSKNIYSGKGKARKLVKTLTDKEHADTLEKTKLYLHQKKRRFKSLTDRLAQKEKDDAIDNVPLCFGTNKLFNKQYTLVESGYIDAASWKEANNEDKISLKADGFNAWLADWTASRNNQFFILGSGDEFSGCQGCRATQEANGSFSLRVRLPYHLEAEHGAYLTLKNIKFNHGQNVIVNALNDSKMMPRNDGTVKTANSKGMKRVGTALSYRFKKDKKGWRVFVTTQVKPKNKITCKLAGAIGIDINIDHLALSEIDRFGNVVFVKRIPCVVYGKSSDQAESIIGKAVKEATDYAANNGKPLVREKLDFAKKKQELKKSKLKESRMLSSFAYSKTCDMIDSACFRKGVEVIEVNPAFTSVIGAVNFAQQKGISIHQGAATAIARRGLNFSERSSVRAGLVPAGNGGHVTFSLPVRNRGKHVWSFWGDVRKKYKAALAAHFRSGEAAADPAPLSVLEKGSIWNLSVGIRFANRQENCSPDVMIAELPF